MGQTQTAHGTIAGRHLPGDDFGHYADDNSEFQWTAYQPDALDDEEALQQALAESQSDRLGGGLGVSKDYAMSGWGSMASPALGGSASSSSVSGKSGECAGTAKNAASEFADSAEPVGLFAKIGERAQPYYEHFTQKLEDFLNPDSQSPLYSPRHQACSSSSPDSRGDESDLEPGPSAMPRASVQDFIEQDIKLPVWGVPGVRELVCGIRSKPPINPATLPQTKPCVDTRAHGSGNGVRPPVSDYPSGSTQEMTQRPTFNALLPAVDATAKQPRGWTEEQLHHELSRGDAKRPTLESADSESESRRSSLEEDGNWSPTACLVGKPEVQPVFHVVESNASVHEKVEEDVKKPSALEAAAESNLIWETVDDGQPLNESLEHVKPSIEHKPAELPESHLVWETIDDKKALAHAHGEEVPQLDVLPGPAADGAKHAQVLAVAPCLDVADNIAGPVQEAPSRPVVEAAPEAELVPEEPLVQPVALELRPRQTWWDDAEIGKVNGLEQATCSSRLLDVELVRHRGLSNDQVPPWGMGQSAELYTVMGAQDPASIYVAFWMNMSDVSLLCMSEVVDLARIENCLADDIFGRRCKLLLQPVRASLPMPAKGPRDAEFAGPFFGRQSVSFTRQRATSGAEVVCLQIDLFSKWLIKMAMSKIGFRLGNVVEVLLLDWPGRTLLSACRLLVTEEFQRIQSGLQ